MKTILTALILTLACHGWCQTVPTNKPAKPVAVQKAAKEKPKTRLELLKEQRAALVTLMEVEEAKPARSPGAVQVLARSVQNYRNQIAAKDVEIANERLAMADKQLKAKGKK